MNFFKISFKNMFAYRMKIILSIANSVLYIAINIMIWRYLYRNNENMIAYMTRYTIIVNIIGMFYSTGIANRIGDKVAKGDFVMDLIKPINLFFSAWQMELAKICSGILTSGIFIVLIFMPYLVRENYYNIGQTLLAVILGHILYTLIYSLVGFLAYIFIKVWPLERLFNDTIRLFAGVFIPISLLPGSLKKMAIYMPFRFLYSLPAELLLGSADTSNLYREYITVLIWILVFAVANWSIYRMALRKAVVLGG